MENAIASCGNLIKSIVRQSWFPLMDQTKPIIILKSLICHVGLLGVIATPHLISAWRFMIMQMNSSDLYPMAILAVNAGIKAITAIVFPVYKLLIYLIIMGVWIQPNNNRDDRYLLFKQSNLQPIHVSSMNYVRYIGDLQQS